ncbi:uncharacterized protein PV07_08410 [Cladophialophora immunda]|uniref:Uncharacterized protein n=1 Tax=Cladophialophora immunda TaxID=569365 RepID=A0A0D2AJW9_9EURO|nr:uncharacterized protein PV07_08410 [Cladophialophora immunda]KIW25212.1 hypothetical protein PV07_08410 [Cladophialophora immunda]OQV00265.1 hypothetical protein CLAIMM_05786 [Cladophialophora immunda]
MSVTYPGWNADDISDAARAIHTLLKNVEPRKGAKRKHREQLQYLRHYLLPKLRLIGGYVKDIEESDDYPRKAEWEADLTALEQAWHKFEDYLISRQALLPGSPNLDGVKDDLAWTWDELSGKIEEIRLTARDVLDDVDRLILLEICDRFGLVLPRLDTMVDKIESYGECVSTYRKDVQEVLYTIRSNRQDLESLNNLMDGSMADLARKITDSQSETEAIKSQLEATSEKLDHLLAQLAEQRRNCTTKTDRKYLDQLRKEVKKQSASVAHLRTSVDENTGVMAEFLRALEKLDVRRGISQCASGALTDMSEMLSKTVSSLERLCDSLKRQTSNLLFKKARFWRRAKSTDEIPSPADHDGGESNKSPSESEEVSSSATSAEDGSDSANSSTRVETSPAASEENPDAAPLTETTAISTSMVVALPAPLGDAKSAGISIRDLTILLAASPEEAAEAAAAAAAAITDTFSTSPPPLPRRSSARKSYQYVLRTRSQRQSQALSFRAIAGPTTPAAHTAATTGLFPSAQHSTSSSWSSMSLALSSSEVDSPCPIFSAPSSLPSPPSSVYEDSIGDFTPSYPAAAVHVAAPAEALSLLAQLEKRYSLTVVSACT